MAGSATTRIWRWRALLCAVLAAALCAPRFGLELSLQRREQPVQVLAAAGPAPAVMAARGSLRLDQPGHRAASDLPFLLRAVDGAASYGGRSLAVAGRPGPKSRDAAAARAGRSPPAIS